MLTPLVKMYTAISRLIQCYDNGNQSAVPPAVAPGICGSAGRGKDDPATGSHRPE